MFGSCCSCDGPGNVQDARVIMADIFYWTNCTSGIFIVNLCISFKWNGFHFVMNQLDLYN